MVLRCDTQLTTLTDPGSSQEAPPPPAAPRVSRCCQPDGRLDVVFEAYDVAIATANLPKPLNQPFFGGSFLCLEC